MRRYGRARAVGMTLAIVGALALSAAAVAGALAAGPSVAVDLSGTLRVVVTDDSSGHGTVSAWLETGGHRLRLILPGGTAPGRDGTAVHVHGTVAADGAVAVDAVRADAAPAVAAGPRVTTSSSTMKILVVIAHFTDLAADGATTLQASSVYAGAGQTVASFYAATSRGLVSTATTVVGPWSLGIAKTCNELTTWSAGDTVIAAHGLDPSAYDHVVIWTTDVSTVDATCGSWAGKGTLGGSHVWVDWPFPAWQGGAGDEAMVASHEIGHNLGLHHAATVTCWNGTAQVSLSASCPTLSEYGDPFSVMGDSYTFAPLFDADELADIGWLGAGETVTVASVGSYSLVPVYGAAAGVRLLRIPRPTAPVGSEAGAGYWRLETRTALPGPFDTFGASPGPAPAGVLVRWNTPGYAGFPGLNHSYLIDGQPTATDGGAPASFVDAPFAPGTTFTDAAAGITVTVTSADASGATVTVGDTRAPTGPASLATVVSPGSVQLTWPAGTDNLALAGYVVRRDGAVVRTVGAGTLTWTDTTVSPETTYVYTVAAKDTAGLESGGAAATVRTPGLPGAPTNVAATPADASALVSWSAPASDGGRPITGYRATAAPGGAFCTTAGPLGCTITGLANGTPYEVTVVASSTLGPGPASNPAAGVTPRTVPGAPTTVTATLGTQQAHVSWSAPASDGGATITGYAVTTSPGGATCSTGGATGCTVIGLADGTPYSFTVRAANAAGQGAASSASTPVIPVATSVACTPGGAGVTVTILSGSGVACSATAGSGASFTGWTAAGLSPGSTTTTAASFTADAGGPGSITAAWSDDLGAHAVIFGYTIASVAVPPGAPTSVSATRAGSKVQIAWSAPVDTGGDPITLYTATLAPGGRSCTSPSNGCSITALADGPYTATVVATTAAGPGPASSPGASFRIDTVRPVVGAPLVTVASGGSLRSATVPVAVTWTGSDAASGIGHYELLESMNGSTWKIVANPAAPGVVRALTASSTTTYRFRVRAVDRAGNTTLSAAGPAFRATRSEQTSTAVRWSGPWSTSTTSSASGGTVRSSTRSGASASFTFTGRSVGWVAYLASSMGRAYVYVDGRLAATVDLRSSATAWRRIAFAKRWSASGTHVIRIVCRATTGRPRVDVDAFVVLR